MNYRESLNYLNSFANLERLMQPGRDFRWNLERVRYLMEVFGHPEKDFFPVLIAGTKGKGSTGFFLESILEAAGIRTGFYSSPHLESPLERIRLEGKMISPARWARGLSEIRTALRRRPLPAELGQLTYFEIMTFLAVLVFSQSKVRVGIFEAGMGGRLDAVNALDAKLSIITTIGLDHEAFLGDTVEKIAAEKAGIIRPGAFVVAAEKPSGAAEIIRKTSDKLGAHFLKPAPVPVNPGLEGIFQKRNAGLAVRAAEVLKEKFGFRVGNQALRRGLRATDWPGRMELIKGRPSVLLDGAHNPAAAEALTDALKKKYPNENAVLVFGSARDKRSDKMLSAFSRFFRTAVPTKSAVPRSQDVAVLLEQSRGLFNTIVPAFNIRDAIETASALAGRKGLVVVTGSFYVVGEARKLLLSQPRSFGSRQSQD